MGRSPAADASAAGRCRSRHVRGPAGRGALREARLERSVPHYYTIHPTRTTLWMLHGADVGQRPKFCRNRAHTPCRSRHTTGYPLIMSIKARLDGQRMSSRMSGRQQARLMCICWNRWAGVTPVQAVVRQECPAGQHRTAHGGGADGCGDAGGVVQAGRSRTPGPAQTRCRF